MTGRIVDLRHTRHRPQTANGHICVCVCVCVWGLGFSKRPFAFAFAWERVCRRYLMARNLGDQADGDWPGAVAQGHADCRHTK